MEKGQRVFGEDEGVREETVGSEAGYELTFQVEPATIRTRVKRTAAEPVDYLDKQVILADQLDADALLPSTHRSHCRWQSSWLLIRTRKLGTWSPPMARRKRPPAYPYQTAR